MQEKIFKYLKDKHNINLNNQQRQAAMHERGPCLVLAVPGAGKTTVLITRLALLTTVYKVNPKNILCLTFSRASAIDMKERYEYLFNGVAPEGVGFSTIHSFALSVIRNYERITTQTFKIIESQREGMSKTAILKRICFQINKEYISEDAYEELCTQISYVKNSLAEIDFYSCGIRNFRDIYKEYEQEKRKHNLIDYDDMLTKAYNILKEESKLLNFYKNQYKYILVDEAQDSSPIQNRILELVAKPNSNIYMVGDDDQSIYGFRAADPAMMLDFSTQYKGAALYFMEYNYRSTSNIVQLANNFIKSNDKRYSKNIKAYRDKVGGINIIEVRDESEQLKHMLSTVNKAERKRNIAILYRNNLSSIPLIDEFDRRKVPFYIKEGKGGLLKYKITQDIIAIINIALNKFDKASFEKIYYKINSYLSKDTMNYLKALEDNISIYEGIRRCQTLNKWQKTKFREFEERLMGLTYKNPSLGISYILYQLGYKEYLNKLSTDEGASMQSSEIILAVLKAIAKNTPTLIQFIIRINELESIIEEAKNNKNKDVVTLTTIHSAKGLEFDSCYIVDALNGLFPWCESNKANGIGEELQEYEEERRLFYVGITRAINNLCIYDLKNWNGQTAQASDFIKEVKRFSANM